MDMDKDREEFENEIDKLTEKIVSLIHEKAELKKALVDLVADLEDAEEDRNPETGKVYNSVKDAKRILKEVK